MEIWYRPILPIVYDDTLSYYEQLCKFSNKLNEVIENINNFSADVSAEIDAKITVLKDYVDTENQKQNLSVEEKIKEVYNYIEKQLEAVYEYINGGDTVIKMYVESEIAKLKKYVDDAILGNIVVHDPTTGYKNTIDIVINHIYDTLRYYGIRCYDFDGLHLTCTDFDSRNISALEFDTLSLLIIGKKYAHYIFNPIDGNYDTLQRVLYTFFQFVRSNAINTNEFDTSDNTADELNVLDFTAFEFDDEGKNIIPS